jgi:hypothetical protein
MTELPPFVMIQHSDDGGMTWSHEIWKPLLNPTKNYLYRVVLQRGGSTYNRMYRLRYSENSSFTLVSAHATITLEP